MIYKVGRSIKVSTELARDYVWIVKKNAGVNINRRPGLTYAIAMAEYRCKKARLISSLLSGG